MATYFFLCKKNVIADDKRNIINFEGSTVHLFDEFINLFENGVLIGKMMLMLWGLQYE